MMVWYRDRKNPEPVPQGDGADTAYEPEPQAKSTRMEAYPQMNSVQQDEAIALLKAKEKMLHSRIKRLEAHVVNHGKLVDAVREFISATRDRFDKTEKRVAALERK